MRGWGLLSKANRIEKELAEYGIKINKNIDFSNWSNDELKELINSIDRGKGIPSKFEKRITRMEKH